MSPQPLFSLTKKPRRAFRHFFKARVFGLSKSFRFCKTLEVFIFLYAPLGLFHPLFASLLLVSARPVFSLSHLPFSDDENFSPKPLSLLCALRWLNTVFFLRALVLMRVRTRQFICFIPVPYVFFPS